MVCWSTCDKCDFSVLSGPGVLYHVPKTCTNTSGRSEQLFPAWAGVPRLALAAGNSLSLCARSFLRAPPPPPAPPAVPLWPPRCALAPRLAAFFWQKEEVQSRAYAPPHASPVYRGPSLPLPATHTLTRVAAWVGPQDHAAGPESLDTGGAHAFAVGHHGPAVVRRDEAARPSELRVVRIAVAVAVEARPMSHDPLERQQLVRLPLAGRPPRRRVVV